MNKKLIVGLTAGLLILGNTGEAIASKILQPVAASTNMGEYFGETPIGTYQFSANHVRDQSGLSKHYTSMVDNFESYIASSPSAYHEFGQAIWSSVGGGRSGNFDLAFGGSYVINSLAIWNLVDDPSAIRKFNLLLANDSSFNNFINVGNFTASNSLGTMETTEAQIFTFVPTTASFARLEIWDTWSPNSSGAAFNEVAFGVTPVPLPGTIWLLGFGFVGLAGTRLRKKGRVEG